MLKQTVDNIHMYTRSCEDNNMWRLDDAATVRDMRLQRAPTNSEMSATRNVHCICMWDFILVFTVGTMYCTIAWIHVDCVSTLVYNNTLK